MILYKKGHYDINVAWEDVIRKIECEFIETTHALQVSGSRDHFPRVGIIGQNSKFFGTMLDAVNAVRVDVENKYSYCDVDTYVSFCKDSCVHGRHSDDKDVLLVQAIGCMEYGFDNMKKGYFLNPGDSLFIPQGTYHTPKVHSPRCTLSFGLMP
tara:strand:- start:182 stop:643 length:462 start_codon:yes stop_codon:yes gene_type:complete